MINPINTAKIFAIMGSNSSLIPLGIKDIGNTVGMTAGSYVTGSNVEGKDRFIDEAGTQVIWLLGIPFFKKVIDKTVYKFAKLNPKIDTRILKDEEIFKKAKKYAPKGVKASFQRVENHKKLFKNLALAKFGVATALTLISYSALTIFRHKHTEKNILKELKKEQEEQKAKENNGKKLSFSGKASVISQFMFDPVKNTMIIDGGITAERLAESRNPQDVMGYIIKEGGFWTSMYLLGPAIQKLLEKKAARQKRPIDLDIRVLQDDTFKQMVADRMIDDKLKAFSTEGTDAEIYERLFKQDDNILVKMAKKSDIIGTVKKSEQIDTQKYIDIKQIKALKEKIENLSKEFKDSEKTADEFFQQIRKLKKISIVKNIGYSIAALGIVVPGIMVAMRFLDKDNKEFAVKKQMKEKLQNAQRESK